MDIESGSSKSHTTLHHAHKARNPSSHPKTFGRYYQLTQSHPNSNTIKHILRKLLSTYSIDYYVISPSLFSPSLALPCASPTPYLYNLHHPTNETNQPRQLHRENVYSKNKKSNQPPSIRDSFVVCFVALPVPEPFPFIPSHTPHPIKSNVVIIFFFSTAPPPSPSRRQIHSKVVEGKILLSKSAPFHELFSLAHSRSPQGKKKGRKY